MLNIRKSITLNGESVFDGKQAAGFSAIINSDNPADMTINQWQTIKALYKENRVNVNADFVAFQEKAYELQDSMLTTEE